MTPKQQAEAIISTICSHYTLTREAFDSGRAYRCADARKVAVRMLIDLAAASTISDAAALLDMQRPTASIALKTLREILPFSRTLRDDVEAITAKCESALDEMRAEEQRRKKPP